MLLPLILEAVVSLMGNFLLWDSWKSTMSELSLNMWKKNLEVEDIYYGEGVWALSLLSSILLPMRCTVIK